MRFSTVACAAAAMCLCMPALAKLIQSDEERDFIPGERVIFYDDYSDMAKGAVKPDPDGWLPLRDRVSLYPNIQKFPKNFTVETEFVPTEASGGALAWIFEDAESGFQWAGTFQFDPDEIYAKLEINDEGWSTLAEGRVKIEYKKLNRLAIWFQNSRIRLYVNDERAVDINQVELKPWSRAVLQFSSDSPASLGTVRIAESMPDISQILLSTGKYVSHGIQFDVNSDKLRPESMNVIKEIAAALQKAPSLKLRIEGHTDSTGDAARNLELSKRRAESVKNALTDLGIAADRLTTDGFGQTRPIATNDTPQGRAENRRVELVKM